MGWWIGWAHTVMQGIRLALSIMAVDFPWPYDPKAWEEIAPSMVSHDKALKGCFRLKKTTSLQVGSPDNY